MLGSSAVVVASHTREKSKFLGLFASKYLRTPDIQTCGGILLYSIVTYTFFYLHNTLLAIIHYYNTLTVGCLPAMPFTACVALILHVDALSASYSGCYTAFLALASCYVASVQDAT